MSKVSEQLANDGFTIMPDTEESNTDEERIGYGEELAKDSAINSFEYQIHPRIKLTLFEMAELKKIIGAEINSTSTSSIIEQKIDINNVRHYLSTESEKLKQIPVTVEETESGRILVKVGPCDLSGVGGHQVRAEMIKSLVNQALEQQGFTQKGYHFENVDVSACVGVRGRQQMAIGFFVNNRDQNGTHMNAYVKTYKEKTLTHWEPRKGPQSFFNDTLCAMITSTTTSMFEKRIRENSLDHSAEATASILKSKELTEVFKTILKQTQNRISYLVEQVKAMAFSERKEPRNQ